MYDRMHCQLCHNVHVGLSVVYTSVGLINIVASVGSTWKVGEFDEHWRVVTLLAYI